MNKILFVVGVCLLLISAVVVIVEKITDKPVISTDDKDLKVGLIDGKLYSEINNTRIMFKLNETQPEIIFVE